MGGVSQSGLSELPVKDLGILMHLMIAARQGRLRGGRVSVTPDGVRINIKLAAKVVGERLSQIN